jgi:hypothetical protein
MYKLVSKEVAEQLSKPCGCPICDAHQKALKEGNMELAEELAPRQVYIVGTNQFTISVFEV